MKTGASAIRIVFLYSEAMDYTYYLLRGLRDSGAEVHLVSWDLDRQLPTYEPGLDGGITCYPRSGFDESALVTLLKCVRPAAIITSGWMDRGYVTATRRYARIAPGTATVIALDTQFEYSARKLAGTAFFRLRYRYYTHCWVPGSPQYAYARLLGFSSRQIIPGLYVANAEVMRPNRNSPPRRRFVYVGRLAEEKNVALLLRAYERLTPEAQRKWPLNIYGDGPLRNGLEETTAGNVRFHGFVQPGALARELAYGGVLVLPSRYEPWGVIVHEACLSGMSLVLSDRVGAGSTFLIEGYNGRYFDHRHVGDLLAVMESYTAYGATELLSVERERSLGLAQRVELASSVAALLSVARQAAIRLAII